MAPLREEQDEDEREPGDDDVRGVVRFVEHQLEEILGRHGPWLPGEVRRDLSLLLEAIAELSPPPAAGRVIHVSWSDAQRRAA